MPAYTPIELRIPTAITATPATVYTATAVTGIMRTYTFQTITAHSVTLSREADGVGTRIVDNYLLTINVPFIQNGWYVIPTSGILQVDADSVATNAPVFGAWGYSYV